jgi:hypothetical protein
MTDSDRLTADPDFTAAALLGSLIGGMEATGHESRTKFAPFIPTSSMVFIFNLHNS